MFTKKRGGSIQVGGRHTHGTAHDHSASHGHTHGSIDPDVIVLGGGVSNTSRLYDTVPRLWPRYVFSDRVNTKLVPPRHGDSSGVRGAARLWRSER